LAGCGIGKTGDDQKAFFTSGNREADQQANQKMAEAEQLAGSGEGPGEQNERQQNNKSADGGPANSAAIVQGKLTLFDRLGGESGVSNIVADFIPRALNDPRVNWERKDVRGGFFRRDKDSQWKPTPAHLAVLENHICQFISLATGGPSRYDGKEIKATHAHMRITNPEFDATIGDLKASLDRLQIANREQKELLAIIESTRAQIVTER
jgi:hemoglobin